MLRWNFLYTDGRLLMSAIKNTSARTNDDDNYDPEVHISNVAANIHDENSFHNYPTVDLPTEFPNVWLKLQNTMKNVMKSINIYAVSDIKK